MKICKPLKDTAFQCLAGACPDTCCAGWEIPIDETSAARYDAMQGAWGLRLRESMTEVDGERQFRRRADGRCTLLQEDGLCALYGELGREQLCRTCDGHPRFTAEYGGLREIMPGLSCPEWTVKWLMTDEPAAFITEESDELPVWNDIDGALFYRLKKARERAFAILQDRTKSLRDRIFEYLALAEETDGAKETDTPDRILPAYMKKLRQQEILTERWCELLSAKHLRTEQPWREIAGEQILIYYVFRFWLKGVYDGRVLPWAKFAVWSYLVICVLGADCTTRADFCEVARLYAKETEHNAENVEKLHRCLCRRSGRYSAAGLRRALEELS